MVEQVGGHSSLAGDPVEELDVPSLHRLEKNLSVKKLFRETCATLGRISCGDQLLLLIKKESGIDRLRQILTKLFEVAERCLTVLKSRYTMSVFWQAGLDFFLSLQFTLESHGLEKTVGEKAAAALGFAVQTAIGEVDPDAREAWAREKLTIQQRDQERRQKLVHSGSVPGLDLASLVADPASQMQRLEDFLERQLDFVNPRQVHHEDRHELRITPVEEEDLKCSICLEDMPVGSKAKKMPKCGHLFHDACIMESLERNKSCPLCRDDPLRGVRIFTTDDQRNAEASTNQHRIFS